jgi:hypothetical protein
MQFAHAIDFAMLMEPVALRLLGEPNKRLSKLPRDLRFGANGSMSVDCELGCFFDHENKVGGKVIDLVRYRLKCDHSSAVTWLRREGFLYSTPRPRPHQTANANETSRSRSRSSANDAPKPRFVCTYDYVDEKGSLIHQTVRFADPKGFKQRRPNPEKSGEWIWNLDGVCPVLYRLPDLLRAVAGGQTVYVVEGEKDADSLRALGLAATTNPMGAGKWRSEYSDLLRGADVVLIEDNDEAGRNHVEVVATSLKGAKRIRVLYMPEIWPECPGKADISEWLAAGGTVDKFRNLIAALPDWKPRSSAHLTEVPWPVMDQAAYYGLAGDVVRTTDPHTEADPNAVLLQYLSAVGNAIGRGPFYKVEGDQHFTKLNVVLVGDTSVGRKGTALGRVLELMGIADPEWATSCVKGGMVSGEGLIHHVRDAVMKYSVKTGQMEQVDSGVSDKRLFIDAQEFSSALAVMERPGNTLSPVLRDAWGSRTLHTLGKNQPEKSTGSHISINGHITPDELRRKLSRTELANGFGNRILWLVVKRSKKLPHGGHLPEKELERLGKATAEAITKARTLGRFTMTDEAAKWWEVVYGKLGDGATGMVAEVTARAAPQIIRITEIYAALDGSNKITLGILRAAVAVWDYCDSSANRIWGAIVGDPVADTILNALRARPIGMSRTEIRRELFSDHEPASRIADALSLLARQGRAHSKTCGNRGRRAEVWFAGRAP